MLPGRDQRVGRPCRGRSSGRVAESLFATAWGDWRRGGGLCGEKRNALETTVKAFRPHGAIEQVSRTSRDFLRGCSFGGWGGSHRMIHVKHRPLERPRESRKADALSLPRLGGGRCRSISCPVDRNRWAPPSTRSDRTALRFAPRLTPRRGHQTVPRTPLRSYSRGSEYRDQVQPQQGHRCAISGPEDENRVRNQTGTASSYPVSGDPRAVGQLSIRREHRSAGNVSCETARALE